MSLLMNTLTHNTFDTMKRLLFIVRRGDTEPIELLNSITLSMVGLVLVLPGPTFSISNLFSVIALIAPEEVWGGLFLLAGLSGLAVIILGRRIHRQVLELAKTLIFSFFFSLFFLATPFTTAYIWLVCGLGSAWCFIRISNNRHD